MIEQHQRLAAERSDDYIHPAVVVDVAERRAAAGDRRA